LPNWATFIKFVMQKFREVKFYKRYALDFIQLQKPKVVAKIYWTISLIERVRQVPSLYLKHLEGTDGLYEIRVQYGSDIFRIFCCFDDGMLVILFNGFQKKSQRTPAEEIKKALKIKNEYEQE
jgi:phage-related protein